MKKGYQSKCRCGGNLYMGLIEMHCDQCKSPLIAASPVPKKRRKQLERELEEAQDRLLEYRDWP